MNPNLRKAAATPAPSTFCARSLSSSSSCAAMQSSNSATLFESILNGGDIGSFPNFFSASFFQPSFSPFGSSQCGATPAFTGHFTSTPTNSCYSLATSALPLESHFNEDAEAAGISFRFEEMFSKLNDLTNAHDHSHYAGSKCGSGGSSAQNTDTYSSSDWSDVTPKYSQSSLWPHPDSSQYSSDRHTASPKSYLSSPRPIRALKRATHSVQTSWVVNQRSEFTSKSKLVV